MSPQRQRPSSLRRAIAGLVLLGLLAAATLANLELVQLGYQRLVSLQHAHAGAFAVSFAAMFVVAALSSLFPASLLGVAAGAAFGFAAGFALSAVSLLAAALIAFLAGRYFFRPAGRRLAGRFVDLDRLEARLARHGWRYALLLRSAPLAPFGITSYGLGLTPIGTLPYLAATLGALPFLAACVYLGSVGQVVASQHGTADAQLWRLALLFTGAAALAGLVGGLVPRLARRLGGSEPTGR